VFRKLVGMTPAAYRAKFRKDGTARPADHGAVASTLVTRVAVARMNGR
jgi:hypothetical protein